MTHARKLVLRREPLAELSTSELGLVAGGTIDARHTFPCLNTRLCPLTPYVPLLSIAVQCPTNVGCPELTAPNCSGTCTTA